MNCNNLFLFFYSITLFNKLVCCNSNQQNPAPVPKNLTLDLKTLNKEDYTIYESNDLPKRFGFSPKANNRIFEVKINDKAVWKNLKNYTEESVIIYTNNQKPTHYSIVGKDSTNTVVDIHFKLSPLLFYIGMAEFFDSIYSLYLSTFKIMPFKFDFVNSFDLVYHRTANFQSSNGLIQHFSVTPRVGHFNHITDNSIDVYREDKMVNEISYWFNDSNELLLKLSLKGDADADEIKYCKRFETVWSAIDKDEFDAIFTDKAFDTATDQVLESPGDITKFNLLGIKKFDTSDAFLTFQNLAGIPTLLYSFNILEELSEGTEVIFNTIYYNPLVYVFRGNLSFDMIEIVHFSKDDRSIREFNDYYIKNGANWARAPQNELHTKIMNSIDALKQLPSALQQFKDKNFRTVLHDHVDSTVKYNLDFMKTFSVTNSPSTVPPAMETDCEQGDLGNGAGSRTPNEEQKKKKSGFYTVSVPLSLLFLFTMTV